MKKYTAFELNLIVTDLDGTPVRLEIMTNHFIDLTVRNAFRRALGASFSDEQNISFDKKMFRNDILEKVWRAELTAELKTEEQAELKYCVGKMYSGEVLLYLIRIIERSADTLTQDQGKKKEVYNGSLQAENNLIN